jgi:DNA polymerase I-like protein with 3'-5' exonuclease and polymerase domains
MATQKKYKIVNLTDSRDTNEILKELRNDKVEYVAFDIETNSNIEKSTKTIGIGITYYFDEGYYFPFAKFDSSLNKLVNLTDTASEKAFVRELCLILSKKKLIMHNGVFDVNVIKAEYGIDLTTALYADTILLKHTVDEERPFGLKEVAELYKENIGFTEEEAANQEQLDLKESVIRNGGKWTKKQKDIYKGDLELIAKYCCADVDLTLKLFDYFENRVSEEGLLEFFYNQEVMPLYKKATIPMKFNGVFVDINYFKSLEKELESDIMKLTNSVFDLIKEDIQPLVEEILDNKVKETKTGKFAEGVLQYYSIPIPSHKKTGKPTLAKSALQSLLNNYPEHPALEWLLHEPRLVEVEVEEPVYIETTEYLPVDESEDGEPIYGYVPIKKPSGETQKIKKVVPDPEDKGPRLPKNVRYSVKKEIFVEKNPELPNVFNLSSNEHLSWLLFECYKETPKSYSRETGNPQVNKDSLETYDHLPFIKMLLELKKQEKLLNTYVKPILETNINGWIYPSMLQFGTTSGRYSCAGGLNLQTLPRFEKPSECPRCDSKSVKITNHGLSKFKIDCSSCSTISYLINDSMIKRGFIAPPGYKVVNADFSSLEPRIFSWVCGDPGLKRVWIEGLDLYSQIAIDVFGLEGVSARETDPNYLKKKDNASRQKSKVFTLAVPYGANKWRIAGIAKEDPEVTGQWIDNYLGAYPDLEDYMTNQEVEARSKGYVQTKFGRIRHLPEAKKLYRTYGNAIYSKNAMKKRHGDEFGTQLYYKYRNQLNNAKNFPIQATAAHVCNAALIKLSDLFVKYKIDGWIALQVHDEITCIVKENQAELASKLLKEAMEDNHITRQIDIPILAEPLIANNFAEAK